MAGALTQDNGAANRVLFVPFLLIMLGPVLVPVWVTGLVSLLTRPVWRPVRFFGIAFLVALLLTLLTGGSPYYVLGLLAVIYAAGCVRVSEWLATSLRRRWLALGGIGLNAVVATLVGLPIIPISSVGSTLVPAVNQGARETVGWPEYVGQVARAYEILSPSERAGAVVVTTNYGEAGAVARYGPALGLPAVVSGHNELADATRPPAGRMPVVVVGRGALQVASRNASCTEVSRLDNRRGVDNEEQGQPVAICRQPRESWLAVWPQFRHLD
jgi:hypothetical protein